MHGLTRCSPWRLSRSDRMPFHRKMWAEFKRLRRARSANLVTELATSRGHPAERSALVQAAGANLGPRDHTKGHNRDSVMNRIIIAAAATLTVLLSSHAFSAPPPARTHANPEREASTPHRVDGPRRDRDHDRRYSDNRWYDYDARRHDWYWRDRHDAWHYEYRRARDTDHERRYHNNHWYYYDRGRDQW
jgi:hypothetical protein